MRTKPSLGEAMNSPLALDTYFFPVVSVHADPQYQQETDLGRPEYSTKVVVEHDPDNSRYQVVLEILSEAENEEKRQAYRIHLVAIGFFRVDPSWPNDPIKLLHINGASILYSAAREFLITITARGPWGQIILPSISFIKKDDFPLKETKNDEK